MRNVISTKIFSGILGLSILFFFIHFAACSRQTTPTNNQHYLPVFLKEVQLGQAQATVLKLRPAAHIINTLVATQWQQFTEDIELEAYTTVHYDFDKTGEKKLVALTISHKNEETAAATFTNFGGKLSDSTNKERTRSNNTQENILASLQGSKVRFYLPMAAPKNPTDSNQ